MYSTLFHIPSRLGSEPGIPLFGFGLLLVLWAMAAVGSSLWVAFRSGWSDAVRGLLLPLVITGAMIVWVLPALDDGRGIPIRGYGVMLLAAVAAGTWLSIVRGRRMGFDADTLSSWLSEAGLRPGPWMPLAPDPRSRGPLLFVQSARRVT